MRLGPEDLLPTDPGPWRAEEGKELANAVEEILTGLHKPMRGRKEVRDYRLIDAPSGLVRRFLLQKPEKPSDDWIPWRELSDELFERVTAANTCKQAIYRAQLSKSTYQVAPVDLTAVEIFGVFEDERRHSPTTFDLSDVYICIEADILKDYENRDLTSKGKLRSSSNSQVAEGRTAMTRRVFQASADWSRDILVLVGCALTK